MRKYKMLLLVVAVVLMIGGSVLPALAVPSDTPPSAPTCSWDWDRYLWHYYGYELWAYTCDYGDGNGPVVNALWNPDSGYL